MKIGVVGTGYVGLVAGAGFADFGNDVVCVDIDESRVAALSRGELPIHEPNLPELVRDNVVAGRLRFTTDLRLAVSDAEVVLICVGTPPGPDGAADLSQVLSVAGALAPVLSSERFTAVVLKSTVPVGTGEKVFAVIADGSPSSVRFAVLSNPEFLKEGCAVEDFLRPMRVIVGIGPSRGLEAEPGGAEERLRTLMRQLYQPVVRTNDRLLFCHSRAAELCKYASNAYLAMRVSFINDIANLCEQVGADVEMVRRGMGMDRRIGDSFLFPGMGYGGSCFPKDTLALAALARAHGLELPLVEATDRINNRQRLRLFHKLRRHFGLTAATADDRTELAGKTVAVWGLAFKPETDDVREAPALALIERLLAAGATVRASDPKANASAAAACAQRGLADRLSFFASAYEAATGADALVVCTEWREFRQPNFQRLKLLLRGNGLFDGRNIWDGNLLRQLGFHYYAIGR